MEESLENILIINGHQPYPFAEGRLNGTLVALAREHLERRGYQVEITEVSKGWDVRFFGMTALPTFSAHDVMKNPDVEADLARYRAHLEATFPALTSDKEVA